MKLQLSSIAIAIVIFVCVLIDLDLKNWKKQDRVIEWDIHWYYSYLPAEFIYDDITLTKSDYRFYEDYYLIWPVFTPEGKKIIKTTMGLAILYAPFFFVAHSFAFLTDYPENGFSEPYKIFLLLSAIFYLLIGLDYLKKTLRHLKFSDIHISITILLIGLGTNLLAYSSQSAPMPHVYNFCLFSVFIYQTIKWYESQSIKTALIIGFLIGLISLIRPSNILISVFFIFYGITSLSELRQRVFFFIKNYPSLLAMLIILFLVWTPQFIYWKITTGNYLYYSYNEEGFFFNSPKIIKGLFSFRKGWLTYTPMMAFGLIGIYFLKGELKKLRLPIVLFLVLNIYVIFSWWCWWYGGTYGQRSMVDSYALMAIPFASFIKYTSEKKWYHNALLYSLAVFFVWLNIFQTYQFELGSLHYEGMTKELYFKQFGKLSKINDFDKYVDPPNNDEAKKGNSWGNKYTGGNEISNNNSAAAERSGKRILLKAINGKYVIDDRNKGSNLYANSDNPWEWETFEIIEAGKDKINIRSSTGKFVCADQGKANVLVANRDEAKDWEAFKIIDLENGFVAFLATNGKYLSADKESLQLFANSDSIGDQEKFLLIEK